MGFFDFILIGLGLGLTSGICTWIISDRSAFKRGLIMGLERGHREGFDVGYQAGVCEMTFGEGNAPLDNSQPHIIEIIDYEYLIEDMPSTSQIKDTFEPVYNRKDVLATIS